ncbi:MAG: GNAT family N-acetyltransferase [Methylobacteriaceae bacterium]|nr:GNAT family N-acetyltransferase [Methylobacteriaceae bacterium]MBV9246016.1 GNAT family N-acetyltransferase [Methylobacteriaceae bacterium]MBV9637673.1 GNAT family N-acetyltransferase [Methylobacteriaceae bacterium]MBV9705535.1 GNAT family N-acetyltransferase [Methylobacteriaceae bacterium]
MSLSIRRAGPSDAPLILALVRELAEYERLAHEVVATQDELAAALFGQNPRVFCDLAEWTETPDPPQPAGFALWFYNFSSFRGRHGIFLEDLFVRPAHRSGGIGQALLRHLARRCLEEGLARLEWDVLDWNEPSIAFYKAHRAVPVEGWTRYRLTGDALGQLADGAA